MTDTTNENAGRRLRVLHVINGLGLGGAESALFRLVTNDPDHEHSVVSLKGEEHYVPLLRERGVHVDCLDLPPGVISRAHLRQRFGLAGVGRALTRATPDLVQTWMYHADLIGGFAARRAGIRALCWNIRLTTVHGGSYGRSIRLVSRLVARLSGRWPSRIVSCARAALETHVALGYPRERIVLIPNGYDLARFRPAHAARAALRERLGRRDDCRVIGVVGRWDPVKDYVGLLDALTRLPPGEDWVCAFAGERLDADNDVLRRAIAERGLGARVATLGPVADTPGFYAGLDVHVLSSLDEGFPNVVAEALACGVPSVVTRVGDASEIVGGTGWVVPPGDPDALARGLGEALREVADAANAARRSAACRARAREQFGIDVMVSRYSALWREVVEESAARPGREASGPDASGT